jgi:hypothetical protein
MVITALRSFASQFTSLKADKISAEEETEG